jgi:hypothetical protein
MKNLLICIALLSPGETVSGQATYLKLYGGVQSARQYSLRPSPLDQTKPTIFDRRRVGGFPGVGLVWQLADSSLIEVMVFGGYANRSENTLLLRSEPQGEASAVEAGSTADMDFTLQVERYKYRRRNPSGRWFAGFGALAAAQIKRFNYEPRPGTDYFALTTSAMSLAAGVVPRLQFGPQRRLLLTLDLPVQVVSFGYSKSVHRNPVLTPSQQEAAISEFGLFTRLQLRFGAAWRLGTARS